MERRMTPELLNVLWACYAYWEGEALPLDERLVCYSWAIDPYRERFGREFSPSRLRELEALGYLAETTPSARRKYYRLINPDRIRSLLGFMRLLDSRSAVLA